MARKIGKNVIVPRHNNIFVIKISLWVIGIAGILFQYGCGIFAYPGMYVIHPASDEKIFIPIKKENDGVFREVICWSDSEKKRFKTLQKRSETLSIIRTYDLNGKVLAEQSIPFVPELFPYPGWAYAFPPDGNKLIFFKDKEDFLSEYNFATKQEKLLWKDVGSPVLLERIHFINNNYMVLFLSADHSVGREKSQIVRYNLNDNTRKVLFEGMALPSFPFYVFTDDRQMAAFRSDDHEVTIVNLVEPSLKKIHVQGFSKDIVINHIAWKSRTEIGIIARSKTSDASHPIVIYNLNNNKVTPILDLDIDRWILKLFFIEKDKLLVVAYKKDGSFPVKYYYLIDMTTREIINTFDFYTLSSVWSFDKNTFLFEGIKWTIFTYYFFNDKEVIHGSI